LLMSHLGLSSAILVKFSQQLLMYKSKQKQNSKVCKVNGGIMIMIVMPSLFAIDTARRRNQHLLLTTNNSCYRTWRWAGTKFNLSKTMN
jgi:hypothetical protein